MSVLPLEGILLDRQHGALSDGQYLERLREVWDLSCAANDVPPEIAAALWPQVAAIANAWELRHKTPGSA